MSAPTPTRPHPATTAASTSGCPGGPSPCPPSPSSPCSLLILNPADAQAATGDPAIAHLLELVRRQLVTRRAREPPAHLTVEAAVNSLRPMAVSCEAGTHERRRTPQDRPPPAREGRLAPGVRP